MGGSGSKQSKIEDRAHQLTDEEDKVGALTEAQLTEFKEAFDQYDHDGGGSIDAEELKALMMSVGSAPSDEEVKEMIRIADADGSGSVDFYEFVTLMAHKMGEVKDDSKIREAFDIFDMDGSGYISKGELQRLMINVGEPVTAGDVQGLFEEIDSDNDGSISVDEFCKIVASEETQEAADLAAAGSPAAQAAFLEKKKSLKLMRARINRKMQ